jgi:hypothetical protein
MFRLFVNYLQSIKAGHKLRRVIMALVLAASALAWNAQQAGATSYNTASQGSCQGTLAVGDSWTNWSGGLPWDYAHTWGYLYVWQGGTWALTSSSYANQTGSSGNAQATDFTAPGGTGKSWYQTGQHQASFFSGTKYSSGNIFICL